jgi:hypothetical protein
MPEQRYSVNDHRKGYIINHNKSDLHRPGMEPPAAQFTVQALLIELTGRLDSTSMTIWFYYRKQARVHFAEIAVQYIFDNDEEEENNYQEVSLWQIWDNVDHKLLNKQVFKKSKTSALMYIYVTIGEKHVKGLTQPLHVF